MKKSMSLDAILDKAKNGEVSLGRSNDRLRSFSASPDFVALFVKVEKFVDNTGKEVTKHVPLMESASIKMEFSENSRTGIEYDLDNNGSISKVTGETAKGEVVVHFDGKKAVGKLNLLSIAGLIRDGALKSEITATVLTGMNFRQNGEPALWVSFRSVASIDEAEATKILEPFRKTAEAPAKGVTAP